MEKSQILREFQQQIRGKNSGFGRNFAAILWQVLLKTADLAKMV